MTLNMVQGFAAQELERYYHRVTGRIPGLTGRYRYRFLLEEGFDGALDEYEFCLSGNELCFKGAHDRAVLYCVYDFCETVLGVRFIRPGFERIPRRGEETLNPAPFRRRFAVSARGYTMDTPDFREQPVDALVKLGYNTLSVSAAYWEKIGSATRPELEKRGMRLSLSGHDLGFFLPPEQNFPQHPEWFAELDGKRDPRQLCFSSEGFRAALAREVIGHCRREKVQELVLMFNDNSCQCECELCRPAGFMKTYQDAIEYLSRRGAEEYPGLQLYQLAYNPALAWEMLEEVPADNRNNCMVACWGRDYSRAMPETPDELSARFHGALERWSAHLKQQGRQFGVFEYYADHWMMGTLLPPLCRVIGRDIRYLREKEARRVDVLLFGVAGSLNVFRAVAGEGPGAAEYPEYDTGNQIDWLNYYICGRYLRNPDADAAELLRDYTEACFGGAGEAAEACIAAAEHALAPLSRFSDTLFKLRITDAWYRDDFSAKGQKSSHVRRWSPEEDGGGSSRPAGEACAAAAQRMSGPLECLTAFPRNEMDDARRENLEDFLGCMTYLYEKCVSLSLQYEAQCRIAEGDFAAALPLLERAAALETGFRGNGLPHCREWIGRCGAAASR